MGKQSENFVKPSEMTEEILNELITSEDIQESESESENNSEETPLQQNIKEAQEEWKPDYKVKVLDNEYEIDEFLRPIINKENYSKVKELYEKAYGLDPVKQKYQKVNEELEKYRPYLQDAPKNAEILNYMGTLLNKKDYRTLAAELNIPDDALLELALEKARLREMPPEERQAYEASVSDKARLYNLEMQNQRYQQMIQQGAVQERTSLLDSYLMSDNVKSIAENYDNQVGRPGAFREEVIASGQFAAKNLGKDLSVEEAVQATIFNKRLFAQGIQPTAPSQGNARVVAPTQGKPVIPNIKGVGSTPTGTLPRSIDDLRKIALQQNRE
jgi:hypothetical protein